MLGTFSAILHKGDIFCDYLFDFIHMQAFWKGVYSKSKKEFALSNLLPEKTPIQKGS